MYKLGVAHVIKKGEGRNTRRSKMLRTKHSPLYDAIDNDDIAEFDRLIANGEEVINATNEVSGSGVVVLWVGQHEHNIHETFNFVFSITEP